MRRNAVNDGLNSIENQYFIKHKYLKFRSIIFHFLPFILLMVVYIPPKVLYLCINQKNKKNMSTKTQNGQGSKVEATPTKETPPAAILTAVAKFDPKDPIADRLARIHEVHTLSEKRKRLIETQDDLRMFEKDLGESDRITLKNHGGNTVEVKKPEAVKKVLELLKSEVDQAINFTNRELLTATL